ncbi:alpha/beta hydrolase [Halopenitus persicus]|uniref:alpha/beta hydrolase n=1 Tax=Halopenitus persicus TaxID=1048396 RepID=UPI000BBA5390|nr:alpha/beta hydrolase [Halopenitus persicus]
MANDMDPQAKAVLDERSGETRPQAHTLSIATYREQFRDLFAHQSNEPVGRIQDFAIPGPDSDVPIRTYHPDSEDRLDGEGQLDHENQLDRDGQRPVVVFFHGGGWVLGDLDCFDNLCTRLTNESGCIVVSVGYRRAPEHPFPAAVTDCYAATEWVAENAADFGGDPDRLAVVGNSAGGTLATVVSLMARDRGGPEIDQQVLLYPVVNAERLRSFESYGTVGSGYWLTMGSMRLFYEAYIEDPVDYRNAYAFPLQADDLSGLPSATILTAGYDPLRDEGGAYADALEADGVPVVRRHYGGQIHDFVGLTDDIDAAAAAIEAIADDLTDAFTAESDVNG